MNLAQNSSLHKSTGSRPSPSGVSVSVDRTRVPLPGRAFGRRLAVGVSGVGLAVLLAACGTSTTGTTAAAGTTAPAAGTTTVTTAGGASAATSTTTAGGANRAALQAYRDCLTQHGVTLPTRPSTVPGATTVPGQGGGSGGGGGGLQSIVTDPANKSAVDACQSLLPVGGLTAGFGNGGAANPARAAARQAYDSCLADNGVVVPTTVAGGPPPSIDQNDPAFAAANAKCAVLLPARGTNGSTTTTVAG